MIKFKSCKIKIISNLAILSITLIVFCVNLIFQLMAQFQGTKYSDSLFSGQSIKSLLSSIESPLRIPYWFFIFVAIIQLYHFIWIIFALVKGITLKKFPFPLIAVIFTCLSFICDTLWVIFFMKLELLQSIIINVLHLIMLLIAIFICVYKIQCKTFQVTFFII